MRAAMVAILCTLAAPLPAGGQPTNRPSRATARQEEAEALRLFEQSVEEYRAGRFQQAVDLLRRAYDLHAEPTLLYNLARALEGLGDEEGAIESYGRYLEGAPNATDRGAIEQRVTTLRRQIAEREALAEAAREPRPEPAVEAPEPVDDEPPPSAGRGPWPWVVSGTGLAVLGAGGALAAVAISRESAADDAPEQTEAWSRYEGARDFATAANVCFVAGAIVLAGGVVWVLLSGGGSADEEPEEDGDAEPDEEDADFVLSPHGVGLRF